jgi:hypothetical protein
MVYGRRSAAIGLPLPHLRDGLLATPVLVSLWKGTPRSEEIIVYLLNVVVLVLTSFSPRLRSTSEGAA